MRKASLITTIVTWTLLFVGTLLFLITNGGGFIANDLSAFELIGKVFAEEIPTILSFQNYSELTNMTIAFFAIILITIVYVVLLVLRIRESRLNLAFIDLGLFVFTSLFLLVNAVVLLYKGNFEIADVLSNDDGGLFELAATQTRIGQVPSERLWGSTVPAWLFLISLFGWVIAAIFEIVWLADARVYAKGKKPTTKKPVAKKETKNTSTSSMELVSGFANNILKKFIRISFAERMAVADKTLVAQYNELKSYILAYGVNSRISNSGEAFRLHTKTYVKITIAGKSLKLYLALNPKNYVNSTIPFTVASNKATYAEIPFVFKVKSDLSFRRAKELISEAMEKDNLVQQEIAIHNWAKDLK